MRTRIATLIAAAVLLTSVTMPATAQEALPIVAAPGAYLSTYATPVAVVPVGAELTFINGDPAWHDVISVQTGPGDQPWCDQYELGKCPVLFSDLIPAARTTDVLGTENLEAGAIYDFYCSTHPYMTGLIIATDGS